MAKRCPTCRAPLVQDIVFHRKIGLNNKPEVYHFVRRYTCPEGCTTRLDFSKARPLLPGVRPMVLPQVKPLVKEPDFNDKLLGIGLVLSLLFLIGGVFLTPLALPLQLAAVALLLIFTYGLYVFANRRVILPESFPMPMPEPEPEVVDEPAEAQALTPIAASSSKPKKKAVEVVIPDVIPPLERQEGEPIRMWVVLEGEEYELELGENELMLDAAVDRDVELDYSCREGSCDSCMVRILAGIENISAPTQEEIDMLGDEVQRGFRLSCQVRVNGPVKILQE